jgi:histone acetyltransferase (RNA polymerase elongator complex component)
MKKHVTIPFYIPHLGCPHECVFCNQRTITGTAYCASADEIHKKVISWRQSVSGETVLEIGFFGGSFTGLDPVLQEEYLDRARTCLDGGLIDSIRLSTRPDYIDASVCERLVHYRVKTVELGVQSFDSQVLLRAKRGHTTEDIYHAAKLLSLHGLDCVIQLMPGLQGDSFEISVDSAHRATELHPSAVRIYPAVVIEHTELAELYRSGEFTPLTLEEAVDRCAAMKEIFDKAEIPVIRMGLHPIKDESSAVIAGPYHPAFGFLVKSRLRRNELAGIMRANEYSGQKVHLILPHLNAEEYIGSGKENIRWLSDSFHATISYTISEKSLCPTFSIVL